MRRRLTTFFLMLCLGWQSLAYAGAEVLVSDGDELVHAMLHFEGEAHHHDHHDHHDHDGLDLAADAGDAHGAGFHQDDSPASVNHVVDDACVFAPALLTQALLPLLSVRAAPPPEARGAEPALPFLGSPERPPKPLP